MAWWKRSKSVPDRNAPPDDPTTPSLHSLKQRIDSLELAHDDLHDQFRRFRARVTKRQSLDERDTEAAPAVGAAAGATHVRNGKLPGIAELRATGRWPIR